MRWRHAWVIYVIGVMWPLAALSGTGAPEEGSARLRCTQAGAKRCDSGITVYAMPPQCTTFEPCPVFAQDKGARPGRLRGRLTIGPRCPLEPCRVPPPRFHGFVLKLEAGATTYDVALNEDGSFERELPAGIYRAILTPCPDLRCRGAFPRVVRIWPDYVTELPLHIDTGIR